MNKKVTEVNIEKKEGNIDVFNVRLKEERIKAGFSSQEALAKEVGVDRVTINYYEQGNRKPDIEVFIKIADTLNVSYDYLLGYSNSPIRKYHETKDITGLSIEAIEVLNKLVKATKNDIGLKQLAIDQMKTINYLIENEENYQIFRDIASLLWNTYKTKDLLGQEFVEVVQTSGDINLIRVSDLNDIDILRIERQLNRLKEDIERAGKTAQQSKDKK